MILAALLLVLFVLLATALTWWIVSRHRSRLAATLWSALVLVLLTALLVGTAIWAFPYLEAMA